MLIHGKQTEMVWRDEADFRCAVPKNSSYADLLGRRRKPDGALRSIAITDSPSRNRNSLKTASVIPSGEKMGAHR